MKLLVNHTKIFNSPYETSSGLIIDSSYNETISQLKQQLENGNPTCILVSGYRGTGKTTLINRVEEELSNNSDIVFIHLNFNKYEKYTVILRKIIRQIYINLSKNRNYDILNQKNPDLIKFLESLYERTFYEVSHNSNYKKSIEVTTNTEINSGVIKKVIIMISSILLSTFNLSLDLIPKYFNILIFIANLLWIIFEVIKLKISTNTSDTTEINRKSLYDDEIAETHVKDVLEKLKEENIKIIFIFDELDKIENDIEIEQMISELKPIMLSNLASFIIISGQKLYYKFANSKMVDDSIISSIFSKLVHTPVLSISSLENIFKNITLISDDSSNPLIKLYIDSLILNSNRIVRKFLNLINQNILWENKIAYININEKDEAIYRTDSAFLSILNEIEQNQIANMNFTDGIKDFFVIQLYIWIQKIKLKNNINFTKEDIYKLDQESNKLYIYLFSYQLSQLFVDLMSKLNERGFINIEKKEIDNEEIEYYKLTDRVNIKKDDMLDIYEDIESTKHNSKFYSNTYIFKLKNFAQNVYKDINNIYGLNEDNGEKFMYIMKNLLDLGIIESKWGTNKILYSLDYQINNMSNENILNLKENINNENLVTDIKTLNSYAKSLLHEIMENYTYYILSKFLSRIGYKLNKDIKEFDFISTNENFKSDPDLLFEIKYMNNNEYANDAIFINRLIKKLKTYDLSTDKRNKLIVFIYTKNDKYFSKFLNNFEDTLMNNYEYLKENLYVFNISEDSMQYLSYEIEENMRKVIFG